MYILLYVHDSYIFDNLSTVYDMYIVWYEIKLNYKQVILSKEMSLQYSYYHIMYVFYKRFKILYYNLLLYQKFVNFGIIILTSNISNSYELRYDNEKVTLDFS